MKEIILKFWKVFRIWFIKKFWPWFLKYVWPFIKENLVDLLTYLSDEIFAKIKSWWNKKYKQKEETFSSKINDAEEKAANSNDKSEIEKYEAIAKVWREVAEMMRKENEELNNELDQIKTETLKDAKEKLDETKLDIIDNGEESLVLTSGDKIAHLPLPKSNLDSENKNGVYDMDLIIAPSQLPFRWNGKEYKILSCGIESGESYAEVEPKNETLEDELKQRIKQDNGLKVYLGLNYVCFTEDYPVDLTP